MWGYGDGFIVCAFRKRFFQRYVKRGPISGIPQLQQVWKSIETKQELIHLSSKRVQIRCFGDYKIPVCDEWKNEFSSLKLSLVIPVTLLFLFFLSTQYSVLGQRKSLRKTSIVDDVLRTYQNISGFLPEMCTLIMRKHQTNPEWGTWYKTDDLLS